MGQYCSNKLAQSRKGRQEPYEFCGFAPLRETIRPYLKGIGSWGYGPGAGVPALAGSGHTPAEAGTPGALSGVARHPACRGTDANQLFRQSLSHPVVVISAPAVSLR